MIVLLQQACRSLIEAHSAGLVHRDIKPANLFVCRLGAGLDFLNVLDFGIVKASQTEETNLTAGGMAVGTPAFMPPELALAQPVDGRTDLYALGCVGFWMLTGQHVFEAPNAMAMMMSHLNKPPTAPSVLSEEPTLADRRHERAHLRRPRIRSDDRKLD